MEQRQQRIQINGVWTTTQAGTVAALVESLAVAATRAGTAVAVNDAVVRRRGWSELQLHDGDRVEIIQPVQGG